MRFSGLRVLRGPNIWSRRPVLEARVDSVDTDQALRDRWPAIVGRLAAWFPALGANLAERLSAPRLLEMTVSELQRRAGCDVCFSGTRPASATMEPVVVVSYGEEEVGRKAFDFAREIILAAIEGREYDVPASIAELRRLDEDLRLGPSTGAIVRAAAERGIPARRLTTGSMVQMGHGVAQRRIRAAETDSTSAIAETIAQDKQLTKMLLKAAGVPVPAGRTVTTPDDAWHAACRIGLPAVVKPLDGNQGKGVTVNLTTREQVVAAFHSAAAYSRSVLVERFSPGHDHRLLVIDGKLVAASRREPPHIIADGRRTVAQIVAEVNTDPRRGEDHATVLSRIPLDDIACAVLAEQGFTPDSVPAAGTDVFLRRNANLSTGGTAADVTDLVHPEVAARAIDAARAVGLDVAGIDVVALDISRPLEEQSGVIVEVNAVPGLRMHLHPSQGLARPVGEAIVDTLFPAGSNGRIPVVGVTGVNGKTTTARLIAHILRTAGKVVGLTCTDGVFVNDRRIDSGDCSGPRSARLVLANPRVEAAVFETARGGILREGLGYDRSDVAVVTNVGSGDHLGLGGIDTLDQLARVKRVVVEAVAPDGAAILNADDPLVVEMAGFCPGHVVFFSRDAENPVLAAHHNRGGRVVFFAGDAIVTAENDWELRIAPLDSVPMTFQGRVGFQVANALAATAAAWSLGVPCEAIRTGLETFAADARQAPARFNVLEAAGATVVIDYGHNASALEALVEAFENLPHERRLVVYTAAGDRRDEDIIEQAHIIGNEFDHVVIYEDKCTRGRPDGEVIRLMRRGLSLANRAATVLELPGELAAIESALRAMRSGDLVLLQADQVELVLSFVPTVLATLQPAASVPEPAAPKFTRVVLPALA